MTFFDSELIKKARSFIDTCVLSGTVGYERPIMVAYHGDGDGCCAAYFLKRYLNDHPIHFYWVGTPDFDFAKAEMYICRQKPFLSVFLDMPVYNRPQMIENLCLQGKVLVYDHHYPGVWDGCNHKSDLLYINPIIHQNGVAFPTTLFAWELLRKKSEFENHVLFMGLFTETWLDRISAIEPPDPSYQRRLKEVAKRIHASFLIHDMESTHYALNFLFKASNKPQEPLQAHEEYRTLENIYNLIQNEKSWIVLRLKEDIKRLVHPKYILKKIESRIRLCGLIASELRWHYPHLVIGIWQRWKNRYYCELRRGRECTTNLASLIERLKMEAPLITGGGHPQAAAFTAHGNHFFEAIDKLKRYITSPGKNESLSS